MSFHCWKPLVMKLFPSLLMMQRLKITFASSGFSILFAQLFNYSCTSQKGFDSTEECLTKEGKNAVSS